MIESELIEACLRNDRIAQRTLYDRYERVMYTLAYRTMSDFNDANDVLQDASVDGLFPWSSGLFLLLNFKVGYAIL